MRCYYIPILLQGSREEPGNILKQTISHGRAAEILGIRKNELIDIYDKLGFSYLDFSIDDLDAELEAYRNVKEKGEIA